jgi:hypothetical protein
MDFISILTTWVNKYKNQKISKNHKKQKNYRSREVKIVFKIINCFKVGLVFNGNKTKPKVSSKTTSLFMKFETDFIQQLQSRFF